jgi:hypothetical protein
MAEIQYTPTESVSAPNIKTVDVNQPYDTFRAGLKQFVGSLQNTATRFETSTAMNQAPEDVASGSFKPLPPLSQPAIAYNQAGEQFEKQISERQLSSASSQLAQNIIQQKSDKGLPLTPDDVQSYQDQYNDIVNHVSGQVSPGNQPYVKNMGQYYGTQGAMSVQREMFNQNQATMKYGLLTSPLDKVNDVTTSLNNNDVKGALIQFNQIKAGIQKSAPLIGPQAAKAISDQVDGQFVYGLSQAIPNMPGAGDPEKAQAVTDQLSQQFALSPEKIQKLKMLVDSNYKQQGIAQGITTQTVGAEYQNLEDRVTSGQPVDPVNIAAFHGKLGYLGPSQGVFMQTKLNALQDASDTIQHLKFLPLSDQASALQQFTQQAGDEVDAKATYEKAIVVKALNNNMKMMQNDSASWSLQSPYIQQLVKQKQSMLAAQGATGNQLAIGNIVPSVSQAMVNQQKQQQIPIHVIPKPDASSIAWQIQQAPDFVTGVQQLQEKLAPYKQSGTDYYAKQDLVKNGLPTSYLLASGLSSNPAQMANFGYAMSPDFKPSDIIGDDNWKLVQSAVRGQMNDFNVSVNNIAAPNALNVAQGMNSAVGRYAAALMARHAVSSPQEAANQAYNDVVLNNYSINKGLLIPKPYDADRVVDNLDKQKTKILNSITGNPALGSGPEAMNAPKYAVINNAHWALSPEQDGYLLVSSSGITLRNGKNPIKVYLSDIG